MCSWLIFVSLWSRARWTLPSQCGRVSRTALLAIQPAAISGTATKSGGATLPNGPTISPWCWLGLLSITSTDNLQIIIIMSVSLLDFTPLHWNSCSIVENAHNSYSLSPILHQILPLLVHHLPSRQPEDHGWSDVQLWGHSDEFSGVLCLKTTTNQGHPEETIQGDYDGTGEAEYF